MGNYGFKLSKPNYDINSAADRDLIFSSAWPSLQVVYDQVATSATVAHGLGFPPLAFKFTSLDNSNPFQGERDVISVDSNVAYTTIGVRTIIYNLDISTSKTYAQNRDVSLLQSYSPDFGIKIVKEGKDIDSTDLRDFILHSRTQSPLILRVMTKTDAVGVSITYTWSGNSPPWLYGFVASSSGVWQKSPYNSQANPKLIIDGAAKTARQDILAPYVNASIVVLRDPMFAPTSIQATY